MPANLHLQNILFVEDEDIIDYYTKIFRRGCEEAFDGAVNFIEARTMAEAEELLKTKQFDAVILDLSLPDSGSEKTKSRLREFESKWPPIMMLTGDEHLSTRNECMWYGASDFTVKSEAAKNPRIVMERIYNMVQKRRGGPKNA